MSFKRDGDDSSWLNLLRKRRISELHAENIPENETFLMRNGRFACLVCSHRPTFDTVQMLHLHRQGKKHQTAQGPAEVHFPSRDESTYHTRKRKSFSAGKEYDERRRVRNVGKEARNWEKKEKMQLERLVNEVDELTEQNEEKAMLLNVKAYKSNHLKPACTASEKSSKSHFATPLKSSDAQKGEKIKVNDTRFFDWNTFDAKDTCGSHWSKGNCAAHDDYHCERRGMWQFENNKNNIDNTITTTATTTITTHTTTNTNNNKVSKSNCEEAETNRVLRGDQKTAYLKTIQAGWVRTREGGWRRDEGVEFDSDDDDPPPDF